jgi:hypothetical protein
MATIYEVWDTLTANQIGSFATKAEPKALLLDVLRVNGPEVANDMAVLRSDTDTPDDDPVLVMDGAEVVASRQAPV